MATVLFEADADWLAPHALVVGHVRVTTDDVSFRSVVPNAKRSLFLAIEKISLAVFDPPAAVLTLEDGVEQRFILADGPSFVRAVEQACVAREKKTVYR